MDMDDGAEILFAFIAMFLGMCLLLWLFGPMLFGPRV
jgi:hypothetical protein